MRTCGVSPDNPHPGSPKLVTPAARGPWKTDQRMRRYRYRIDRQLIIHQFPTYLVPNILIIPNDSVRNRPPKNTCSLEKLPPRKARIRSNNQIPTISTNHMNSETTTRTCLMVILVSDGPASLRPCRSCLACQSRAVVRDTLVRSGR